MKKTPATRVPAIKKEEDLLLLLKSFVVQEEALFLGKKEGVDLSAFFQEEYLKHKKNILHNEYVSVLINSVGSIDSSLVEKKYSKGLFVGEFIKPKSVVYSEIKTKTRKEAETAYSFYLDSGDFDLAKNHLSEFIKTDSERILKGLCDNLIFHDWDKETYSSILTSCDFAIIPINLKSRMASAKPENKLINLWKMGLPVIASNTKSYKRVMENCSLDFVAHSDDEWLKCLKMLSQDHVLRKDIGLKVYNYATKNYGTSAVIEEWDNMFNFFFK